MYYIVVHMIDGTVKFQICTIGGAHIIFQTFVAAIYFIFKCRLTLQFEGGCYIAWQLAFMTQLELTRERFLFIEQLPLLYVDLPLRFRPLGHSAWVGRNPMEANANTGEIQLLGNPVTYIRNCFTRY